METSIRWIDGNFILHLRAEGDAEQRLLCIMQNALRDKDAKFTFGDGNAAYYGKQDWMRIETQEKSNEG